MTPPHPIPTLAALKRLPVGTELYCLHNHSGACRLHRCIIRMQTNAFAYTGDGIQDNQYGWTYWKSARQFEATPTGFKLYYDPDRTSGRFLEYALIPTPLSQGAATDHGPDDRSHESPIP